MIKRVTGLLLLLLLAVLALPALAQEMQVINVKEWVSLREEPDSDSRRVVKVPLGAVVSECQYHDSQWIHCQYGSNQGYVMAQYLELVTEKRQSLGDMQVANVKEWASLREAPNASSRRLVKVPLGAVVVNCAAQGDFVYCEYEGRKGYIDKNYLIAYRQASSQEGDQLALCRQRLKNEDALAGALLIANDIDTADSLAADAAGLGRLKLRAGDQWQSLLLTLGGQELAEVEQGQQLYLIVPADENARVTVRQWVSGKGASSTPLYEGNGAPFMVRCTAAGFSPDCQVTIADPGGRTLVWYPFLDQSTGSVRTQGQGGQVTDLAAEPQAQALPEPAQDQGALISALWAKDALNTREEWDVFYADRSAQLVYVLLESSQPVRDFKLLSLTWENDQCQTQEIYHADYLMPARPLVTSLAFPEGMPAYGLSYVDERGAVKRFAITTSGYDGSLILSAF